MAPANKLTSAAVGQYQPGSAGGANSSTGFASGNLVNPWDFVFMMEGSLLFTSRATRRLDPNALEPGQRPLRRSASRRRVRDARFGESPAR